MSMQHAKRSAALLTPLCTAALVASCGGALGARESRVNDWYVLSTPHVRLETDVGSHEARQTAWALEQLHAGLARVLVDCHAASLDTPVDVTLLAHDEDFRAVAPARQTALFWPATTELAPRGPRVVLPSPIGSTRSAVMQTYTHELAHRFVEGCLPDAPSWLEEGLARYFETMRVSEDDVVVGIPPFRFSNDRPGASVRPDGIRVANVPLERVPTATQVRALSREQTDASHDADGVEAAGAWALVHMLFTSEDMELRERFDRYLATLASRSRDASTAFDAIFEGVDLDAMLASYVRQQDPMRRRIPFESPAIGEPVARRLETAEVHLRWADLFVRRGATNEARAHLELAAQNPVFESRSLLLLASLSHGIERRDLVARAEAIAPHSHESLAARTWIAIEEDQSIDERMELLGELARLEDPTASELARWSALARLNGDGQPAVALSERAVQLEPTSWEAQSSLALSLAATHRFPEARAAFRNALRFTSHRLTFVASQLQRLIGVVDQLVPAPLGATPPEGDVAPAAQTLDVARQPIALVTGTTEATVDARSFGGGCVGFVGRTPAAVFDVPEAAPALALHAHGDGSPARDTVLVVETSTGAMRCDDDSGGWPDPGIFAQLPPGRTRVWVGTYEQGNAGTPFTLELTRERTLGNEPLPGACGLSLPSDAGHGPVVVGARVVLGRHTPVTGTSDDAFREVESSTNWMPEMESFVGREATVTELDGRDGAGCPVVRVDVDAGSWLWRVRDMSRPSR